MSHTPGPWRVETEPQGSDGQYTQYTIQPRIADVFYMNQTGEANARLIAAAPDLLAALERVIRSQWASIDHDRNRTPEACDIRSQICAAIDKARGQA